MAKGYQRHSRGGSFKRRSSGDGLRSYKEQQNNIISALKEQRIRSEQYGDEYTTGLNNKTRTEAENRNALQKFESQAFQNRLDAIKVHAEGEIDALKGQAKEYGEQAKFWTDFSTTGAANFAKLYQGVEAAIDWRKGEKLIAEVRADPNWKKNFDGLVDGYNFAEGSAVIKANNIGKEGDHEGAAALIKSTVGRSNRHFSNWFAKQILDNKDAWIADLKTNVLSDEKNGLENWSKNAGRLIESRIVHLMKQHGISANSPGGRDLLDIAMKWGNEEQGRQGKITTYKDQNSTFQTLVNTVLSAKTKEEKAIAWNALVVFTDNMYRKDDDSNQILDPFNNKVDAASYAFTTLVQTGRFGGDDGWEKIAAASYYTPVVTEWKEWTTDQDVDAEGRTVQTFLEKQTWYEKEISKKTGYNFMRDKQQELADYNDQRARAYRTSEQTKETNTIKDIEDRFTNKDRPDYIDVTTKEGRDKARALYHKEKPGKVKNAYGEQLWWVDSMTSISHETIMDAYHSKDISGFLFIYNRLTDTQKAKFQSMSGDLVEHFGEIKILEQGNFNYDNEVKQWETIINTMLERHGAVDGQTSREEVTRAARDMVQLTLELWKSDPDRLEKGWSGYTAAKRKMIDLGNEGKRQRKEGGTKKDPKVSFQEGTGILAIATNEATQKAYLKNYTTGEKGEYATKASIKDLDEVWDEGFVDSYQEWNTSQEIDDKSYSIGDLGSANRLDSAFDFIKAINAKGKLILAEQDRANILVNIGNGKDVQLSHNTNKLIDYIQDKTGESKSAIFRYILENDGTRDEKHTRQVEYFLPPGRDEWLQEFIGSDIANEIEYSSDAQALFDYNSLVESGEKPMDSAVQNIGLGLSNLDSMQKDLGIDAFQDPVTNEISFSDAAKVINSGWEYGIFYDPTTNSYIIGD